MIHHRTLTLPISVTEPQLLLALHPWLEEGYEVVSSLGSTDRETSLLMRRDDGLDTAAVSFTYRIVLHDDYRPQPGDSFLSSGYPNFVASRFVDELAALPTVLAATGTARHDEVPEPEYDENDEVIERDPVVPDLLIVGSLLLTLPANTVRADAEAAATVVLDEAIEKGHIKATGFTVARAVPPPLESRPKVRGL